MSQETMQKTDAEIAKLMAEVGKLAAETGKINAEARWYPIAIASGLVGAVAAATTIIIKLVS